MLSYYYQIVGASPSIDKNMSKKKLFLLIICCTAANGSLAQQLYKTVGPDGKITFSDRPQIESKTRLSVMHSNILHPVEPPAEQAVVPPPRRKELVVQESVPVITPDVEEAMMSVMGLTEFGRRFEGFCNASAAEAKEFSAATYAWKQRNAAAIEQQKRLLAEVFSPVRRANLIDREQQQMAEELGKAAARAPAARREWCSGVVAELNGGQSDIRHPAMMAVPIVQYRGK